MLKNIIRTCQNLVNYRCKNSKVNWTSGVYLMLNTKKEAKSIATPIAGFLIPVFTGMPSISNTYSSDAK